MPIKSLNPFQVTPELLNEVNTLAAPSMLAAAMRAAYVELGQSADGMALFAFQAEFRQGARPAEQVQISIESLDAQEATERVFQVCFGVGEENNGRVGKWQLHFRPTVETKLLPYGVNQAAADGRTDETLWPRPQPSVATGETLDDAQQLLWLAGQCARGYCKRLDEEWVAGVDAATIQDDPHARRYGGIAVTLTLAGWPSKDALLRCVTESHLPLNRQRAGKIMNFQEMLISESGDESFLLGTARFTVARMSAAGAAVYPDGAKDRSQ
ncbi:MAG: hypothetical protein H6970_07730 [Gammaproteobacteria bacterium]|nr:hypothetical protein [Gammaproteobacteria bacterium]MCP5458080.1 hypothetical protein [Gammaproteobacteria bacterium]